MKRSLLYIIIVTMLFSGCSFGITEEDQFATYEDNRVVKEYVDDSNANENKSNDEVDEKDSSDLKDPLLNATKRITKKPFGIFITPENSLVQPERFSGYHTGTDFEIFAKEIEADVSVFAICSGNIESKQVVDGYGGVIVQSCVIDGDPAQVLYGHISPKNIVVALDEYVVAGEKIAILGAHESAETDGERKHLHLSIVKGITIDLRGYVQDQEELSKWIDYELLMKK